jgi:hypothetical protein
VNCREVLVNLEQMLAKYDTVQTSDARFGDRMKRAWKRLEFEPDDIRELRDRLTSNVTLLSTYLGQLSRYSQLPLCPPLFFSFVLGICSDPL